MRLTQERLAEIVAHSELHQWTSRADLRDLLAHIAALEAERDAARGEAQRLDAMWRERCDNATMQLQDLSERYGLLTKSVTDGRAFMPSPPIYMTTVAPDDAALAEARRQGAIEEIQRLLTTFDTTIYAYECGDLVEIFSARLAELRGQP